MKKKEEKCKTHGLLTPKQLYIYRNYNGNIIKRCKKCRFESLKKWREENKDKALALRRKSAAAEKLHKIPVQKIRLQAMKYELKLLREYLIKKRLK